MSRNGSQKCVRKNSFVKWLLLPRHVLHTKIATIYTKASFHGSSTTGPSPSYHSIAFIGDFYSVYSRHDPSRMFFVIFVWNISDQDVGWSWIEPGWVWVSVLRGWRIVTYSRMLSLEKDISLLAFFTKSAGNQQTLMTMWGPALYFMRVFVENSDLGIWEQLNCQIYASRFIIDRSHLDTVTCRSVLWKPVNILYLCAHEI